MLNSVLSDAMSSVDIESYLICTAASLALGMSLAWVHTYRNQTTRNFMLTLALLPVIVQNVIMLVNGNLGTGVAVMGAFGLVRFRSAPGNSREIGSVFLAMAMGLATGTGYLGVGLFLLLAVGCVTVIVLQIPHRGYVSEDKELRVTIPENLDYNGVFDDLFRTYTNRAELMRVRTVNMGSLYELQYHVTMKDNDREKEFLDKIRCRNGNLSLVCSRVPADKDEL